MQSGQILVIGGLTRNDQIDAITGTPILSRIPFIGSFFSSKSRQNTINNIAIFICPTIVHPKLRGGLQAYTSDKIRKARRDTDDLLIFGETRDPITRLFFRNQQRSGDDVLRNYLSEVDNPPDAELIRTAKEKLHERRHAKKAIKPGTAETPQPGPVLPLPA
jgi:Flp pilus assembly secretin CpaC